MSILPQSTVAFCRLFIIPQLYIGFGAYVSIPRLAPPHPFIGARPAPRAPALATGISKAMTPAIERGDRPAGPVSAQEHERRTSNPARLLSAIPLLIDLGVFLSKNIRNLHPPPLLKPIISPETAIRVYYFNNYAVNLHPFRQNGCISAGFSPPDTPFCLFATYFCPFFQIWV